VRRLSLYMKKKFVEYKRILQKTGGSPRLGGGANREHPTTLKRAQKTVGFNENKRGKEWGDLHEEERGQYRGVQGRGHLSKEGKKKTGGTQKAK